MHFTGSPTLLEEFLSAVAWLNAVMHVTRMESDSVQCSRDKKRVAHLPLSDRSSASKVCLDLTYAVALIRGS
jgi:hypothetical protein